jgi:hypothetical protein
VRSIAELEGCATLHLDAYTNPHSGFAFNTYDRFYGSPDHLTPLDCFAANLLSLNLRHRNVIPLFQSGEGPAQALRTAMQRVLDETKPDGPALSDLHSTDAQPFRLVRDANAATDVARQLGLSLGWTAVTVSKVLHRLRPQLVPICDSVVSAFYGTSTKNPSAFFTAVHQDLRTNTGLLSSLAAGRQTSDGRLLSALRALDIVIWHHERYGCPTRRAVRDKYR